MRKLTPLTWLVMRLIDGFNGLLKLSQITPFAPAKTMPSRHSDKVQRTKEAAPVQPVLDKTHNQQTENQGNISRHYMDLNGQEYRFDVELSSVTVFKRGFKMRLTCHPYFGKKLLPTNGVEWIAIASYHMTSLEDAIFAFITKGLKQDNVKCGSNISDSLPQQAVSINHEKRNETDLAMDTGLKTIVNQRPEVGVLKFIGTKKFPDRNGKGAMYSSFAIVLVTDSGEEKTLQGEGLRDVIAESGAGLGSRVKVQRLGNQKVQIIDPKTKSPVLDDKGDPVMRPKWLWKMTVQK